MKKLVTFLLVLSSPHLFAQSILPPNSLFSNTSQITCPFDETITITAADSWLIYQTLDNKWDGEVDSSICINVSLVDNFNGVMLEQIDPTRALFIRSEIFNDPLPYLSNWLYEIGVNGNLSSDLVLNQADTCENGICTGLLLGFEIPDSIADQTALRERWIGYQMGNNKYYRNLCLATENFEFNNLKEVVYKYTFQTTNLNEHWVQRPYTYFAESYEWFDIITEIVATNMSSGEYFVNLWELANYYETALAQYTADSYPSLYSVSYIEARPEPNSTEQETINFSINFSINSFETLAFQPFTAIRGALVEGSDSLRHIVNFINNGGEFCSIIFDQPFEDGSVFRHQAGNISFGGRLGCFSFRAGSKLIIEDGASLNYGTTGEGILNLHPGSTIEIGQQSTLYLNNKLWMFGQPKAGEPSQVFMELNAGSTFIFGEHAQISNVYAQNPDTKLNIYMNGGVLDMSNLDADSRSLINLIYPTPFADFNDNISVFPNPVSDYLQVKIIAESTEAIQLSWYSVNGELLIVFNKSMQKGVNIYEMDTANFDGGVYFFKIQRSLGQAVRKVVKF